jgi:hypothetical protein
MDDDVRLIAKFFLENSGQVGYESMILTVSLFRSQIDRAGAILRGRLAQLLTVGPSPNPRWLIKFDGQPYKDEEMYERSFGKLIASSDDDEVRTRSKSPSSPTQNNKSSKPQPQGNGTSRKGSNSNNGISNRKNSSTTSSDDEPSKKKESSKAGVVGGITTKTVVPVPLALSEGSNAGTGSDYSSTLETSSKHRNMSARDKVSAREARSQRRQSKIDADAPLGEASAASEGGKRRAPPPNPSKNKRQRTRTRADDSNGEKVVKVKLLTGTLFLYRGRHRRAEFIRRV